MVLATVASLLLAAGAAAQRAKTTDRTFLESVDVEVVEVDVVVTDRKGRPVPGLDREDFELYADGERVSISNFAAFEFDLAREPAAEKPALGDDAGDRPVAGAGAGAGNLTIVLYFDDANLHSPHRRRALRRLAEAVEPWRNWDVRYMLATFRNRLEVLVTPTPDLDVVLAAAAARPRGTARGLTRHLARRRAIVQIVETDPACDGAYMSIARRHAAEEETRLAVAVGGLADLVSTLGGIPGKKAVFYLSDSLPENPGESLWSFLAHEHCASNRRAASRLWSELTAHNESRRLERLARHANANRVTFYPVDAAGIRAGLAADVSIPLALSSLAQSDAVYRLNAQSGMQRIASETGGKLLANSNDLAVLIAEAAAELEAAYSLGFMPEERRRGEVRDIRVELAPHAREGRRVSHRRNYVDKPLSERLADRLLSTAYLGALDNPLEIRVGLDLPKRTARKRYRIGVNVVVPEDAILQLPGPERARARLRLWLLALEREGGGRTAVREKLVTLGRRGVTAKAGVYWFNVSMKLARGDYDVAVGVRDETSGVTSLVRLPAELSPSTSEDDRPKRRRRTRGASTGGH